MKAGVNLKDQVIKMEDKIEDIMDERKTSGLLTKTKLSASDKRQLQTWEKDLDALRLEEANLYRILAGEDVKEPRESKSFREADVEHIALATGVDLRSQYGDMRKQRWTKLPERDFPEKRLELLVTEWVKISNIMTFLRETSHRLLIDRVIEAVVELFDGR